MQRMLPAELTILVELQPIRIVFLVLVRLVIAALALRAGQRNCVAHPLLHPLLYENFVQKNCTVFYVTNIIYHTWQGVSMHPAEFFAQRKPHFRGWLFVGGGTET